MNIFLLDIAAPGNPATDAGNWFIGVCAFVALLAALLTIATYFATRREVDDLKARVDTLETETREAERRLEKNNEDRASRIHKRVDRVLALTQRIAGKLNVHADVADLED